MSGPPGEYGKLIGNVPENPELHPDGWEQETWKSDQGMETVKMCRNKVGLEALLTDKEKEKIKKIQKHLNNGNDVIYGEIEEWTLEDVYLMLLGKAIENYVLEGETE